MFNTKKVKSNNFYSLFNNIFSNVFYLFIQDEKFTMIKV